MAAHFDHRIPNNSCITHEYMHTRYVSNILLFHVHFLSARRSSDLHNFPLPRFALAAPRCQPSCSLDNKWRRSKKSSSNILRAMTSIQRKLWRWQPNWTPLVSQPSKTLSATSVAITKALSIHVLEQHCRMEDQRKLSRKTSRHAAHAPGQRSRSQGPREPDLGQ